MRKLLTVAFAGLTVLATVPSAFGQKDTAGSKDYPGITRMPGYYIADYKESPFDSHTFTVTEGGKQKEQPVEGRRYEFRYNLKDNAVMPSQLQVVRNYQNAARAAGGQVLYDAEDETTFRLAKGGKEVWVALQVGNQPSGLFIIMVIVEKQGMQQEVTVDAKALAGGIVAAGRVAVYGIYFDTGKADLKAESTPALVEIGKLLQQNPALRIYIVGHTDMVADAALNMKLSQARAQAVVNALAARHGVAAARMIAIGAGPYAPVASNKTEDGRAKNRRVELVEIATK